MKHPFADRVFAVAVLLPFAATIAYLHLARDVPFVAFVYGSGSWGFGCILKLVLYHGIVRRLRHDPSRLLGTSALNGLVSGVTELGVALVFFHFLPVLSFWEVLAFGVGIGTIEAFLVATPGNPLEGTALEKSSAELEATLAGLPGRRGRLYAYLLPFSERLIAAVIHVGTRGLVYVAYRLSNPLPLLLALTAFVFVDGIIAYRLHYQGRFADLRVLKRTYIGLSMIALLVLAVFLLYWPRV
ncbi:MAG: hypothetical protein R6X35_09940 [Candidatus Krumholzibacteriia bacterium]